MQLWGWYVQSLQGGLAGRRPGRSWRTLLGAALPPPRGLQSSSLRPSPAGLRPTDIREGDLLYSEYTDLNVNHIEKVSSQQHLGWLFDQTSGHRGLATLTRKIYPHRWFPQKLGTVKAQAKYLKHIR